MLRLKPQHRRAALGLLAAVLLAVILIRMAMAYGSCAWYGYQTDRETRYAAFVGCMVKINNKWHPRNELRIAQ